MPRKKDLTKTEFSRTEILNMKNDAIAHRLMNSPAASWRDFAKQFRDVLLLPGVNEETIIIQYEKLLRDAQTNLRKYRPRKGVPADLAAIEKLTEKK